MNTSEVSHYGVKGMHWGSHNAAKAAEAVKNVKDVTNLIPHKTQTVFNNRVKELGGLHRVSNEELQAMLNRLDMEKRYRKILNEDADRRARGAKAAGKILLSIGKIALPVVLAAMAGTAGVKTGTIRVPNMVLQRAIGK